MKSYNNKIIRNSKKYEDKMQSILNGTQDSVGEDMKDVSNETDVNANVQIVEDEKPKKRKIPNIFALLITCIFIVIGGGLLYFGFSFVVQQSNYVKVDAKVISVRTFVNQDDGESVLMAVPTYEYYVNGVRYEVESKSATNAKNAPIVGDIVTIRYNPENPKDIVTKSWTVIMIFVMGGAFVILGGVAFVQVIKGKLK